MIARLGQDLRQPGCGLVIRRVDPGPSSVRRCSARQPGLVARGFAIVGRQRQGPTQLDAGPTGFAEPRSRPCQPAPNARASRIQRCRTCQPSPTICPGADQRQHDSQIVRRFRIHRSQHARPAQRPGRFLHASCGMAGPGQCRVPVRIRRVEAGRRLERYDRILDPIGAAQQNPQVGVRNRNLRPVRDHSLERDDSRRDGAVSRQGGGGGERGRKVGARFIGHSCPSGRPSEVPAL